MSEPNTNLLKYVEEGNIKAVMEIIKSGSRTAAVNTGNNDRVFPLHVAAQSGNLSMVELLLKHGAKVTCIDNKGLTPLHYAVRTGHKETVLALLKQNAQVDCHCSDFWTPMHYATYYRHADIVTILCEAKAHLEETDLKTQTPLHIACKHGYKEIVQTLISFGARVDGKDSDGVTPIELLQLNKPPASPQHADAPNLDQLSKEMKTLLHNPEFSDITFVFDAAPVERIPAHRSILKARAPALLRDANSDSGRNQTVRLPGMSAAAFRLMLEWIYTATIEIEEVDLDVAFELYNKADDFKLPRLRAFVENVITSNIDETTTKTVLDVAISFKATGIIDKCSLYIIENFGKILAYLKSTQQPIFSKDDFLEMIQHIDMMESLPPELINEAENNPSSMLTPSSGEPSASFNMAGGSLKVKIQRPPVQRPVARATNQKKTAQRTNPPAPTPTPAPVQPTPPPPAPQHHHHHHHPQQHSQSQHQRHPSSPPVPAPTSAPSPATVDSKDGILDKKGATEAKKMQGKTLDLCRQIIKEMMNDQRAPEFNSPVDPVALKLPDYPIVIKNPMDLGTIQTNLSTKVMSKKRTYKTLKEFSAAARLVFDNARIYNMPGSSIYLAAEGLAELFEQKYSNIKKQLGIHKQYDPAKTFQPPAPVEPLMDPMMHANSSMPAAPLPVARSPNPTSAPVRSRSTGGVPSSSAPVPDSKKNVKRRPKAQTPPAPLSSATPPPALPPSAGSTPSATRTPPNRPKSASTPPSSTMPAEPRGVKTASSTPASGQPPHKKRKIEPSSSSGACPNGASASPAPSTPVTPASTSSNSTSPNQPPPQPQAPKYDSTILHQQLLNLTTNFEWAESRILNIIHPNGTAAGETEMEIDLDTLSHSVLQQLQELVDKHLPSPTAPGVGEGVGGDRGHGGMMDNPPHPEGMDSEDDFNDPEYS